MKILPMEGSILAAARGEVNPPSRPGPSGRTGAAGPPFSASFAAIHNISTPTASTRSNKLSGSSSALVKGAKQKGHGGDRGRSLRAVSGRAAGAGRGAAPPRDASAGGGAPGAAAAAGVQDLLSAQPVLSRTPR